MPKSHGIGWRLALVTLAIGCSSGGGGSSAPECAIQTQAFSAQCNACVNSNCCAELTACGPGTACNTCATGGPCTPDTNNQLAAIGLCLADRCTAACPEVVGTGGSGGAGTGGSAAGQSGGSGGSGDTSGTGGTGGTGGSCSAPCGASCCDATQTCFDDSRGNVFCASLCTANSECGPFTPVCTLLENGLGACTTDVGGLQRCATGTDCSTGACAPNLDTSGNPVGPYICVPNDGAAYHGCNGFTFCGTGTCCFGDTNGNLFCATQCTNDSQCGAAHCQTYDNSNTSCSGTMGCGPF